MIVVARAMMTIAWLTMAAPATAHPATPGVGGFTGGLLHPLAVPTHMLGVLALALLIGLQTPPWLRIGPLFFVVGLVAGFAAMTLAYVPTRAEETLLLTALLAGLFVALARPLPWAVCAVLAGTLGAALVLDSPPAALSLSEANRTLLGTGLAATVMLVVPAIGASFLRRPWLRLGARIAGSWMAASAILVLALRLAA